MHRQPLFHKTKQFAPASTDQNLFASVLEKQMELIERLMESSGTNMAGSRPQHRGQAAALQRQAPIQGHKSMPLSYNPQRLASRFGSSNLKARRAANRMKHGDPAGPLAEIPGGHRPLYELGFFQDCALDARLWGMMVQPQNSIINMIPVRSNNFLEHKFGFITGYTVQDSPNQTEPDTGCDPCLVIESSFDACKISFPYGRLCRRTQTLEVNELIRRFCMRQYDDFFFVGDLRGEEVFPGHFGLGVQVDRNFITQSAIRRQLFNLGRYFQLWMMRMIWTGDPANNIGDAYKEFFGLTQLIRNDYGTPANPLPIESLDGDTADCSVLNSDIKDFGGGCINAPTQSPTIWELIQEMENTLYSRALGLGQLPVQWGIFMITPLWNELTKVLPCMMASDGCVVVGAATPNLNINDGGSGMFNLAAREQMQRSMSLSINGRTYPVYLDDTMPYEFTPAAGGDPPQYCSDIWFIPFVADGEEVLYWEHIDYSELDQELSPVPGSQRDVLGWSDDGRFHHVIAANRWCFELQSKMEVRLIFLAPHLAGRIMNVCACPLQAKPMAFDGAGNYAPTLGG